jgi:hypothetical protein
MCKSLANPLPEPAGIIARVVFELINDLPISFTDPSPPTATIISNSFVLFSVISIACFALWVYFTSTLNCSLSKCRSISFSTSFCFPTPEIGLIINSMFFLVLMILFF